MPDMGEHLVGHVEHDLPVACTSEREQHLERAVGYLHRLVFFDLLARLEAELDERNERDSHKCSHQRHQYQHHEDGRGQDMHFVTDRKHDQLHQPPRIHQCADIEAVFPALAHETSRKHGTAEFTDDGHQYKDAAHPPQVGTIQQPDLCA